jgi:hypothetical protein
MAIVNTALLKHPMNYIIVILMLVIAGIGGALLLQYFGAVPATPSNASST